MTRRSLIGAIAASAVPYLASARNWNRQEFPEWSQDWVDKILTDSPWAQQHGVSLRYGFGDAANYPVQTEVYLTTRWASALPVRQATALAQFGRERLDQPKAQELLRGEGNEYVIEVAGFPAGVLTEGARKLEARLQESAYVMVKGRKALKAESASVPEHGMHLMATIRFERYDDLADSDGVIEFGAKAGLIQYARKFRLRDMHYNGHLEL